MPRCFILSKQGLKIFHSHEWESNTLPSHLQSLQLCYNIIVTLISKIIIIIMQDCPFPNFY